MDIFSRLKWTGLRAECIKVDGVSQSRSGRAQFDEIAFDVYLH